MGIDGFSMGNLGLNADLTSAQMASQSEQLAMKDAEIKIKTVDESSEDSGVRRKDDDEKGGGEFNDGFKKNKKGNDGESEDDQSHSSISEKYLEENSKDFAVRINQRTGLIELYSAKDKKVLETISAEDLMYLISKLDSASGVLVNRKI